MVAEAVVTVEAATRAVARQPDVEAAAMEEAVSTQPVVEAAVAVEPVSTRPDVEAAATHPLRGQEGVLIALLTGSAVRGPARAFLLRAGQPFIIPNTGCPQKATKV
jgi:hypothetical protein